MSRCTIIGASFLILYIQVMNMKIKILSKSEAVKMSYTDFDGRKIIIFISDLYENKAGFNRKNNSIKEVLYLSFEDVGEPGTDSMTADDAEKIKNLVLKWVDKADTIWVQCEMGVSRSAGIAMALMEHFRLDLTPIILNSTYCPNMLCYELTRKALKDLQDKAIRKIKIEHLKTSNMKTGIISTEFKKLDKVLNGGIRKGALCFVGAREGYTNTTFATQLSSKINETSGLVILFSLEKSKEIIEEMVCAQGKDPFGLIIDDAPENNTDAIKERIKEVNADVVVIDSLDLMKSTEKKINRIQETSFISYQLKKMAKELNVAVVCTVRLSSDSTNDNAVPVITDLRCAGSLDQDADEVLLIYKVENKTEIIVAKNRYGDIGTINATFDKKPVAFEEI